ncbi:Chaperone surA [Gossypium australe]|uniref:Chaperone surA n=1 Tax=Gossypium australe TaxID=47621 RepID=A0A5B6WZF3_9ROSI|nr:Chaperone surA [Gossypium australe]
MAQCRQANSKLEIVGDSDHTIKLSFWTHERVSRPCTTHSPPHRHVFRPCVPCILILRNRMSRIENIGRDTGVCLGHVCYTALTRSRTTSKACFGPLADDVESNASALAQGTVASESRPVTISQGGEAREAFFQRLNELLAEFVRTNPAAQHPPPPPNPQPVPVAPHGVELVRLNKPLVDKIRRQGVEEFRSNIDDDPERA